MEQMGIGCAGSGIYQRACEESGARSGVRRMGYEEESEGVFDEAFTSYAKNAIPDAVNLFIHMS